MKNTAKQNLASIKCSIKAMAPGHVALVLNEQEAFCATAWTKHNVKRQPTGWTAVQLASINSRLTEAR